MKSFILRFLTAFIGCMAGCFLAMISVPGDMGPSPFREVIGAVFRYQNLGGVAPIAAVMSGLLLLADWIGPKRIHIAWLALIAVFCGGYFFAMGISDYFGDVDNGITLYLESSPLEPVRNVVGMIMFLIVWLFPVVVLAVIKVADLPKRQADVG